MYHCTAQPSTAVLVCACYMRFQLSMNQVLQFSALLANMGSNASAEIVSGFMNDQQFGCSVGTEGYCAIVPKASQGELAGLQWRCNEPITQSMDGSLGPTMTNRVS